MGGGRGRRRFRLFVQNKQGSGPGREFSLINKNKSAFILYRLYVLHRDQPGKTPTQPGAVVAAASRAVGGAATTGRIAVVAATSRTDGREAAAVGAAGGPSITDGGAATMDGRAELR